VVRYLRPAGSAQEPRAGYPNGVGGRLQESSLHRDSAAAWLPICCFCQWRVHDDGAWGRVALAKDRWPERPIGRATQIACRKRWGTDGKLSLLPVRQALERPPRSTSFWGGRRQLFMGYGSHAINASKGTAERKSATPCWKRCHSYAAASEETRSCGYCPRKHQRGWCSSLPW
jgi:hypothetical protein